ncbi:hypothetical protein Marky_0106 [Marinithermus hydrothermalis DSM 14884]|uniref:Uncharacterized protein n=2 Tax=Marinithermus TaxID=186191 RepID=F2NLN9_MARHT|nr:hypothetical protein Marky_0106 [Marinithermus hydrothermalis DSM 14884]
MERVNIVHLRMDHLRAASAERKGMYHVAVSCYLACLEQVEALGDHRARRYFAGRLAHCYRVMGFEEKARRYEAIALGAY